MTTMSEPLHLASDGLAPASTDRILLVDDDPGAIQLLGRILGGVGQIRFATNGEDALALARAEAPDIVLLDAEMPGISGFQVCRAIKADPALSGVPVIFVTSHNDSASEMSGFELGAVDFIAKPVSPPLVKARVQTHLRMKKMSDDLRRLSITDGLTGLANRRRFDESLAAEWQRARRSGDPLTLLMIDVDHFKLYNDHYGHPAGDACLRSVAQALAEVCHRPADLIARYGGEEFALLLPQTDEYGAWHVARQALAGVDTRALPHAAAPGPECVSVSIGMTTLPSPSASKGCRLPQSPEALVRAADMALYSAKRQGRAQACFTALSAASVC